MLNDTYVKNQKVNVKGFNLEVTRMGTVYHASKRGFVKLKSQWNGTTKKLGVLLPTEEIVALNPTDKGLKTDEEMILINEMLKSKVVKNG